MEEQLLADFERYLKLKSIKTYGRSIKYVRDFLGYAHDLGLDAKSVTAQTIEEYRAYLLTKQTGCSRGTINNRLNRIKSFYRFLVKKRHIATSPFDAYFRGLKRGWIIPKNILGVDDVGKLLDNFAVKTDIDLMAKSMIELLYGSALRISEVGSLTLDDIDFDRNTVYITDKKGGGGRRKLPASEASMRAVKAYIAHSRNRLTSARDRELGYLYPQRKEGANKRMLNSKLQKECGRLGLKVVSTHCFRHSAATHMLLAGAGLRAIQALLGHNRIATTEMYTHVVKEDLKNVVAQFHPREAGKG
jgi:site-specific recombinase XerD